MSSGKSGALTIMFARIWACNEIVILYRRTAIGAPLKRCVKTDLAVEHLLNAFSQPAKSGFDS